jgi:hypothetical protein
VVIGRAARREQRTARFERDFGANSEAALDLLEITELAWHDCYGEPTFPDEVLDDLLVLSDGDLARLVAAARLAVTDWRDLRVAADRKRSR